MSAIEIGGIVLAGLICILILIVLVMAMFDDGYLVLRVDEDGRGRWDYESREEAAKRRVALDKLGEDE